VRRTVPPSAEIEKKIDDLLAGEIAGEPQGALSELASLGAKLIIQRAVEEEFDAWLGRARYERKPEAPPGKRNGFRSRRLQRRRARSRSRFHRFARPRSRSSRSCSRAASGCCVPSR
jgi:transposase-like protein